MKDGTYYLFLDLRKPEWIPILLDNNIKKNDSGYIVGTEYGTYLYELKCPNFISMFGFCRLSTFNVSTDHKSVVKA